jgi:S1-C subfamily serine protease
MRIAVAATASLAAVCAAVGIGFAVTGTQSVAGAGVALPSTNAQSEQGPFGNDGSGGGLGSSGTGGGLGSSGTNGTTSTGTATAAQSVGVVDIVSTLGYQQAEAAGTGMIVTSSGEVLTNNHVIDGATSVRVTVVSTGKTYTASVVGTDPTDDVAVLQLSGASGLSTANFGNASSVADVSVGDAVTGVGNAGGVGGTPSSAAGQVTALNQTITASDSNGSNPETVTGMIETNAPIAAGDSGGPLYDASGKVVGVDTAAQSSRRGTTVAAYAIPITKALSIASQIESGQPSSTIHIGSTGFLGVSVQDTANGAAVAGVVTGGPAAKAGLAAGDVITAVNGTSVTNSSTLRSALATTKPGQQVTIAWTDTAGGSHHATVTVVAGPAD